MEEATLSASQTALTAAFLSTALQPAQGTMTGSTQWTTNARRGIFKSMERQEQQ